MAVNGANQYKRNILSVIVISRLAVSVVFNSDI